jgi:hypothetical protein
MIDEFDERFAPLAALAYRVGYRFLGNRADAEIETAARQIRGESVLVPQPWGSAPGRRDRDSASAVSALRVRLSEIAAVVARHVASTRREGPNRPASW